MINISCSFCVYPKGQCGEQSNKPIFIIIFSLVEFIIVTLRVKKLQKELGICVKTVIIGPYDYIKNQFFRLFFVTFKYIMLQ